MEAFQVIGLGLIVATMAVVLRQQKPELAILLILAGGALILTLLLGRVGGVITVFRNVADRAGVSSVYLGLLLRVVGVAFVADYGAQICRDAGESAIAGNLEFAGKIMILVIATPLILSILDTLTHLIP